MHENQSQVFEYKAFRASLKRAQGMFGKDEMGGGGGNRIEEKRIRREEINIIEMRESRARG